MAHCRSPAKCLKNGHFPSNQIQIVPDSNCCKLFMDNRLPARTNFSPDTSVKEHSKGESQVLEQCFKKRKPALGPIVFLSLFNAPQLHKRLPPRCCNAHARAQI